MLTENDLHYIAGFFDGEGSVACRMVKSGKNGKRYKRLEACITQKDPAVLYWIQKELGYGRIHTRYDTRPNSEVCHDLVMYYRQAREFLNLLQPYLRIKKDKVIECLAKDAGNEQEEKEEEVF